MSPGSGRAAPRVLAELLGPVEAETPYGGRSTTYLPLGPVWLRPKSASERERVVAERAHSTARRVVEAREDGRLTVGRVLRFGGGDWRIRAVEAVRFGWVELDLEAGR